MKSFTPIWTGIAVILLSGFASAQTKREAKTDNRPLDQQVRPGDSVLRLEQQNFPPMVVVGLPGKHLAMMTDLSETILIIRILGKKPELTEKQNWIRSTVSARVEEILKPTPSLPLVTGSQVTFKESGGTMQVNRTTVEAVVPWATPFQVGKRYLVFGVVEQGELILGANASYEELPNLVTARRLMKWSRPEEGDEIETLGVEQAAREIKHRLSQKQ